MFIPKQNNDNSKAKLQILILLETQIPPNSCQMKRNSIPQMAPSKLLKKKKNNLKYKLNIPFEMRVKYEK